VVRSLLDHFDREKETIVRARIASLLGQLSKTPGLSAASLSEELIAFLVKESMQCVHQTFVKLK